MRVDPWIAEGTANRAIVELAVNMERLKRAFLLSFGYDRGAWMQRRKEERTKSTDSEGSSYTASEPSLNEQDYTVLISLCEQAMLDEPYTTRAVFLSALMDRLEERLLAL